MLATKTAKAPVPVKLIYKTDGSFTPQPKTVHLKVGDTLTFKYPADLVDPEMEIKLDKDFFKPATFKNGGDPVKAIKAGKSEYHCSLKGTYQNRPVVWTSHPDAGGFTETSGH